jgi:hypothetical protein
VLLQSCCECLRGHLPAAFLGRLNMPFLVLAAGVVDAGSSEAASPFSLRSGHRWYARICYMSSHVDGAVFLTCPRRLHICMVFGTAQCPRQQPEHASMQLQLHSSEAVWPKPIVSYRACCSPGTTYHAMQGCYIDLYHD